jgi:hypothetical protein
VSYNFYTFAPLRVYVKAAHSFGADTLEETDFFHLEIAHTTIDYTHSNFAVSLSNLQIHMYVDNCMKDLD